MNCLRGSHASASPSRSPRKGSGDPIKESSPDRALAPYSRKPPIPYDSTAYRQRNLIERMFGRLKDYRRVATRYDKLARNFFATVIIAAAITWWI